MSKVHRAYRTKILREHVASGGVGLAGDDALMASGDVHTLGAGLVSLRGNVLGLFRFFEHTFLRLARRFRAEEHHYPVLLPLRILEEVGYFGHFPQQVTFCSHLPEDLPLLDAIAQSAAANQGRLTQELRERVGVAHHALKPAVCLPCYRQYRGTRLPAGGAVRITMQNHVFRHEGDRYDALARLWDFQVRDIVFMGSQQEVSALREETMDAIMTLCDELDLTARLELANDPFFLDESSHKIVYQRLGEVKYELLLRIPHREMDVAASSFNLHRDFYASVYDIRQHDGAVAETACMGFGLERWVYGFLSQKGMDPSGWPEQVAAWVERYATGS
jgi:seryl-tRNA synthetase